jgi:hypothetical protein
MSSNQRQIHRASLRVLGLTTTLAAGLSLGKAATALSQDAYPQANEPKPTGKDVIDPMAFLDAIVASIK